MKDISFDPDDPLGPIKGEKSLCNQALIDYAMMGARRSLQKLANEYKDRPVSGPNMPPTKRIQTLKKWSSRYGWQRRVIAYDAMLRSQEIAQYEQARRDWKQRRIDSLDDAFKVVNTAVKRADTKDQGINQALRAYSLIMQEIRIEYDDLPAKQVELSGPNKGPIKHEQAVDLSGLTDAEIDEQIAELAAVMQEGQETAVEVD